MNGIILAVEPVPGKAACHAEVPPATLGTRGKKRMTGQTRPLSHPLPCGSLTCRRGCARRDGWSGRRLTCGLWWRVCRAAGFNHAG